MNVRFVYKNMNVPLITHYSPYNSENFYNFLYIKITVNKRATKYMHFDTSQSDNFRKEVSMTSYLSDMFLIDIRKVTLKPIFKKIIKTFLLNFGETLQKVSIVTFFELYKVFQKTVEIFV